MGLIKKLKRITAGRIDSFLRSVEDPAGVFPLLVEELAGKAKEARSAEAKAMTAVKAAQRKLDETAGRMQRLGRGAAMALSQGEETTARDALSAQIELENTCELRELALSRAESALSQACSAREQIEAQVADLQMRKDEILTRARIARTQREVGIGHGDSSRMSGGILAEVARMEEAIAEDEDRLVCEQGVKSGRSDRSIDERLRRLENDDEIERRLAELMEKRGKGTGKTDT